MTTLPPTTLRTRVRALLARDVTGGVLLLAATLLALIVANSPAAPSYAALRDFELGPEPLHLRLSVGAWAADGLLAIFFFVIGLELKQEIVAGRLRDPRGAAVPIAAAVGGVALPSVIYVAIAAVSGGEALRGWAIPAATDIAFAVAVLAVFGRGLPSSLRVFLLTLAVVDDLLAIVIIAVFYAGGIAAVPLLAALLPLGLFALAVRRGMRAWYVLLPLAIVTWALVHASGVHATIAGVALGLVVPAVVSTRAGIDHDGGRVPLTEHFAERWSVVSASIAVPVFAFFAAGVTVGGFDGLAAGLADPVAIGIAVALVAGKALGITGSAFLITRLPGVRLPSDLRWPDIAAAALVAGIGFTVSLLVGELAFGASDHGDAAKIGVLAGSLLAAVGGATALTWRRRHHRRSGGERP